MGDWLHGVTIEETSDDGLGFGWVAGYRKAKEHQCDRECPEHHLFLPWGT